MTKPILNGASIVPLVGQRVPASVPQHVGVNFEGEAGALANAFDQLKGPLDFRHPHLGFNRVGNETILMGGMMHLIELFRTGLSAAAPRNFRT